MSGIAATENESTFHRSCAALCTIKAGPEQIWSLLTNTKDLPSWSATVTSIEGERSRQGSQAEGLGHLRRSRSCARLPAETPLFWRHGALQRFVT